MNITQFSQDHDGKPFHSSGYARVARGNTIGSMSVQSFGQRSHVERNRTSVRRYGESMVGQNYLDRGVSSRSDLSGPLRETGGASLHSRGTINHSSARTPSSTSVPPRSFREPPPRYNPYG